MKLIRHGPMGGSKVLAEDHEHSICVDLVADDGRTVQVVFYETGAYGDLDGRVMMRGWSCPPGLESRTGNMTEIHSVFRLLPLDAIETLDIIRESDAT